MSEVERQIQLWEARRRHREAAERLDRERSDAALKEWREARRALRALGEEPTPQY